MKQPLPESELVNRISQGDRDAFAQLYRLYLNNLYRYIYSLCYVKETSEEIVQDVFFNIWKNRENLVNIISIKAYLYRSAKNQLFNQIQRSKVETRALEQIISKSSPVENYTDNLLIYGEYYQIAQNAIDLLPEKRKQIFKLRLNDNLSLDEIASKLSISKSVVKKQLYSGINFVRDYLYKHGELYSLLLSFFIFLKNR